MWKIFSMKNKHVKYAPCHRSLGKCKLKQQGTLDGWTAHRLEWPKSQTWQHQMLVRMRNSRSSHSCWWLQTRLKTVWLFLTKLSIPTLYHPAIAFLSIENLCHTKTCTQMFIAGLFITAKTGKQPRCPSANEWMNKQTVVHPDNGIFWNIISAKKKLTMQFWLLGH